MPSYKSFCWSLGTTSFRTENFNKTIEEQLALLNEFWSLDDNRNEDWEANNILQARYYDFMKAKEFVVGNDDFDLMKRLVKAGSDHSKFMRMINVTCDNTVPTL